MFSIPPVPKSAFAAERWAIAACRNIMLASRALPLDEVKWPHEAGIVTLSMGPDDGIVAWKVSGMPSASEKSEVVLRGRAAADAKWRLLAQADFSSASGGLLRAFKAGIPA